MIANCSQCRRPIPTDDLNVAADIALCRPCGKAQKLSELLQAAELERGVDFENPPAGTWYQQMGNSLVIGASHRSLGAAIGALAITLFWNGIVSVFVCCALSATLHLLHAPVPAWFPEPKMNGEVMGVGMTLFLWLFLTPFMVIGLAMLGAFLSALGGRTEVTLLSGQGTIFRGIGPLGWRRRFDPETVKDVRIEDKRWRDSDGDSRGSRQVVIKLHNGRKLCFGSTLKEERLKFLAAGVRRGIGL